MAMAIRSKCKIPQCPPMYKLQPSKKRNFTDV